MPATSKAQQEVARAALAARCGGQPKSKLRDGSKQQDEPMRGKQFENFVNANRTSAVQDMLNRGKRNDRGHGHHLHDLIDSDAKTLLHCKALFASNRPERRCGKARQ